MHFLVELRRKIMKEKGYTFFFPTEKSWIEQNIYNMKD